ncbi:MAG: electron transfer flavoprotein subunit alpha/FixB family protein, partial [Bacteroidetes bacterium]
MSVLVYTENWDGKFKKLSFELVSYAKQIADRSGTTVTALSIGAVDEAELKKLGNYGADKVLSATDERLNVLINKAYASVIAEAAENEGAQVIIFANNFTGKALSPRVSVKLKAGIASGVNAVPSSYDPFTVSKKVFTGKAFANVVIKSDKKILTLFQNSVEIAETGGDAAVEAFSPALNDADFATKVLDVNKITGK